MLRLLYVFYQLKESSMMWRKKENSMIHDSWMRKQNELKIKTERAFPPKKNDRIFWKRYPPKKKISSSWWNLGFGAALESAHALLRVSRIRKIMSIALMLISAKFHATSFLSFFPGRRLSPTNEDYSHSPLLPKLKHPRLSSTKSTAPTLSPLLPKLKNFLNCWLFSNYLAKIIII